MSVDLHSEPKLAHVTSMPTVDLSAWRWSAAERATPAHRVRDLRRHHPDAVV